jgi:transposase
VTGIPARPADLQLKERVVLDVLRGRLTVTAAARKHGLHVNTITNWKQRFTEGGRAALAAPGRGSNTELVRARAEIADLTRALGEAAAELSIRRHRD